MILFGVLAKRTPLKEKVRAMDYLRLYCTTCVDREQIEVPEASVIILVPTTDPHQAIVTFVCPCCDVAQCQPGAWYQLDRVARHAVTIWSVDVTQYPLPPLTSRRTTATPLIPSFSLSPAAILALLHTPSYEPV